jgi:hypothetical protein
MPAPPPVDAGWPLAVNSGSASADAGWATARDFRRYACGDAGLAQDRAGGHRDGIRPARYGLADDPVEDLQQVAERGLHRHDPAGPRRRREGQLVLL